jgi:hypothetical protein
MNVHKDSSLVEDMRWSKELDNRHNTPKQILLFFQFLFNCLNIENIETVPKVGDLWLPIATMSPHHLDRFFFPQIDVTIICCWGQGCQGRTFWR